MSCYNVTVPCTGSSVWKCVIPVRPWPPQGLHSCCKTEYHCCKFATQSILRSRHTAAIINAKLALLTVIVCKYEHLFKVYCLVFRFTPRLCSGVLGILTVYFCPIGIHSTPLDSTRGSGCRSLSPKLYKLTNQPQQHIHGMPFLLIATSCAWKNASDRKAATLTFQCKFPVRAHWAMPHDCWWLHSSLSSAPHACAGTTCLREFPWFLLQVLEATLPWRPPFHVSQCCPSR